MQTKLQKFSKGELSYSKLRLAVNEAVKLEKTRMRKKKRESDKNDQYIPSNSKISTTLEKLVKLKWVEKIEDKLSNKTLKPSFYSLSKNGKFGASIGLKPEESYRLEDVYHWILRTATFGFYVQVWLNKEKNISTGKIIEGTSIDDVLYKQDYLLMGNFSHRRFIRQEVERAFNAAVKEESIKKTIKDNEVRYVIDERLKEFVYSCWSALYNIIRKLIENILILKKILKNTTIYKNLKKWLTDLHVDRLGIKLIAECHDIRNKKFPNLQDKRKLYEETKNLLAIIKKWKAQAVDIYERDTVEKLHPGLKI